MFRTKKGLVLSMALFLGLNTVLAGCTSNSEKTGETGETATATSTETSTSPELKPVKLKWYYIADKQADQEKVFEAANKIIKEKINATVDFQPIDMGSYGEKLKVIIATGESYDIAWTSNWLNNYVENSLRSAYYPLDDLLTQYAPKLKASIADKYWNATKLREDGNIFAVPNMQYIAFTPAIAFKKDLVDKYNLGDAINNIKSVGDLEPIYKVIKDNEPAVYPYFSSEGINMSNESNYALTMAGTPLYSEMKDLSKVLTYPEVPVYIEMAKAIRNFYLKGYIPKDAIAMKADADNLVKAGKVFSTFTWYKPGIETELKNKYNGTEFIVKRTAPTYVDPTQVRPTMNAISKTSPNPERAMMFLELMNTDKELYNLLVHGIEGEHYTKLDGGNIEPTKDTKYGVLNWVMGSVFNEYLLKGDAPDKLEVTKKEMEEAKQTPITGFTPNTDNFKTELAQLTNVSTEYNEILSYGIVDTDTALAKYSEKLKKAGIDKVKDEVKKQLDEWLVKNPQK